MTLPLQQSTPVPAMQRDLDRLNQFVEKNYPLFVLSGAGCSTESGIPDYRDKDGKWKYSKPVQYQDFIAHETTRKRYWARSMYGWPRVASAQPNLAHNSLTRLEAGGVIYFLLTQNVDGLHQKAGTRQVLDLHGCLENVVCLQCGQLVSRASVQEFLLANNKEFIVSTHEQAPDGDTIPENTNFQSFEIPACGQCDGILKPDVVFFGENVPKKRIELAMSRLEHCKGLLIVGSSLMVYSGFRFVKHAMFRNKAIAAINQGRTRADPELFLKIEQPCGQVLSGLVKIQNC